MTGGAGTGRRLTAAPVDPGGSPEGRQGRQGRGADRRVLIVSASVGAGHDGAAAELQRRLLRRGVDAECRDFLDALPRWLRFLLREGYTQTVTHTPRLYDWLYAALERPGWVRWVGLLIPRYAARQVARWSAGATAVVSTYPLASQSIALLVQRGEMTVPTTTYLTDPSVHFMWVSPHIGRHLTSLPATARIGEQVYAVPMTVAGPLVPDRFANPLPARRRAELVAELHLPPGRPVALVVAGSLGVGRVADTAEALIRTGLVVPLVLCGRNDRLLRQLRDRPGLVAVGWRDDVHELMQLCDVLVHNAGGLSMTESLIAGLPAVTYACIPGHGHANGDVLDRSGLAPLARTVDELDAAVTHQLTAGVGDRVRTSVGTPPLDAAGVVVRDMNQGRRPAPPGGHVARSRPSPRRGPLTRRRAVSAAAGGAALLMMVTLGGTEGVSAATRRGFKVAQMPAGTVAVVVRTDTLPPLLTFTTALRNSSAAVEIPAQPTPTDLAAARQLAAEGVTLLSQACPGRDPLGQVPSCDTQRDRDTLGARRMVPAPLVVADRDINAADLIAAEKDGVTLMVPTTTVHRDTPGLGGIGRAAARTGGVVVVDLGQPAPGGQPVAVGTILGQLTDGGALSRPVTTSLVAE